jgi:lipid-binding SYLF domain-containing protein
MKQAKGVFIVPELVKGAAIVGGSGGTGALLVRNNGQWSDPAFLTIGSISIGPQVGGKAGPVAMFLMTDKAVANFTTHNNFSLNGKAALTIVNFSRTGEASLGKGDVVVWSGTSGLFAGFNISGSDVVADTKDDQAYYNNKTAGTKQIIDRQLTNAQADKLVTKLPT